MSLHMNQDKKKTEKLETLQSHEARLQKRREQAQARRKLETSEQRQTQVLRRESDKRDREIVATEKQSYDREHHKQKRARETIPERQNACRPIESVMNTNEPKK